MNRLLGLNLWLLFLFGSLSQAEVLRLELAGSEHEVPIKVYLPAQTSEPAPIVLFSHGLGGSREGSDYLGKHWSANGFVVVAMQHPGSDASVWKDVPKLKRGRALKEAASLESFMNRVSDVRVVLDYLERSKSSNTHPLHDRLDTARIAMTGHSFGAVTSQAVMGQNFKGLSDAPFFDKRIDCVILMSPSQSKQMENDSAFGSVNLPVLCMTGTKDKSPLRREVTPESRQLVYNALPDGNAYQIVFDQGGHSIFGDHRRNDPRYHAAIERITTEFMNAYLQEDADALDWLRSDDIRKVLNSKDLWEWK